MFDRGVGSGASEACASWVAGSSSEARRFCASGWVYAGGSVDSNQSLVSISLPGVAPAGTASGRTLRVRGRGVTTAKGAGDLLVTVEVAVPARLDADARAAVEALAAAQPDDPRPQITAALNGVGR